MANAGDLQLMNRDQTDGFNLAVGEPRFLQVGFDTLPTALPVTEADLSYPNAEGDRDLLDELGWMYPGKFVVVTNGAKGALMAAYHAIKTYAGEGALWATRTLNAVYWPTHPTIAHLHGLRFLQAGGTEAHYDHEAIYLLTSPNNPNGEQALPDRTADIWDAAYASRIYGWEGQIPFHRISVWSAAKILGLSGLRVGWLVTGDRELYNNARLYMEKTSSGVSRLSQRLLTKFLRNFRKYPEAQKMYELQGAHAVNNNAGLLMDYLAPMFVSVQGANTGTGMYLWAQLLEPEKFHLALEKSRVHVLSGATCGATDEFVRISCGQTAPITESAALALRSAYDGL